MRIGLLVVDAHLDRGVARAGRKLLGLGVPERRGILGDRFGSRHVGDGLELGLALGDDRIVLVVGLVRRELLVRRYAAVLRAGQ